MATSLSTASAPHLPTSDAGHKRRLNLTSPFFLPRRKGFTVSCFSPKRDSPPPSAVAQEQKNPSLGEQLKPLSTIILSDQPNEAVLSSKPKSIWVNPSRPKRSVMSLERQKRSSHSRDPQIKEIQQFARKLNDCEESDFLEVIAEMPHPPTRENALLMLNSMRSWQKVLLFFNWVKAQNEFPLETIFYNVVMKSLRSGTQFQHVEDLALEMIEKGIELDNITYSTIITSAKRFNLSHKAVEWFERMYKTGLMPDEVTYSAILDVYAKLGKVEEVMSLYERGRASGWKPDAIPFSILVKMYGEKGDYNGILRVLQEMKSLDIQLNVTVYNTLLKAMGKAGKPGFARSLFEEMVHSGLVPNERTLTELFKIYGRARWAKDAFDLWERMKLNGWPVDFILHNALLNMFADLGLVEEAENLFEDMKASEVRKPDRWTYTAMLNLYGSGGNADKAMALFKEMSEVGVDLNVMGCTCLIQCLGRAKRIDDLMIVFKTSIETGVKPDDRLCGCLLSVVSYCEGEDADKVLSCLEQANPKLVAFVNRLSRDDQTESSTLKEELKNILSSTAVESRAHFCNCLIDICRRRNLLGRAHELLYFGTLYGLYPGLHTRSEEEWRLDARSLSVGAAHTAFEEWMHTLAKVIQREERLPPLFTANTGAGTHKFSKGLGGALASHIEKLAAPFRESEEKPGLFTATREDIVSWVQSNASPVLAAA